MANAAEGHAEIGIMITASHNPHADNGFKIIGPNGKKPTEDLARTIEGLLDKDLFTESTGTVTQRGLGARASISTRWRPSAPPPDALDGMKIAVDLSNGAATPCMRWIEERYTGTEWVWLGVEMVPSTMALAASIHPIYPMVFWLMNAWLGLQWMAMRIVVSWSTRMGRL